MSTGETDLAARQHEARISSALPLPCSLTLAPATRLRPRQSYRIVIGDRREPRRREFRRGIVTNPVAPPGSPFRSAVRPADDRDLLRIRHPHSFEPHHVGAAAGCPDRVRAGSGLICAIVFEMDAAGRRHDLGDIDVGAVGTLARQRNTRRPAAAPQLSKPDSPIMICRLTAPMSGSIAAFLRLAVSLELELRGR